MDRFVWLGLVQTQVCVISCRTSDRCSLRHIWQSSPPLSPSPHPSSHVCQHRRGVFAWWLGSGWQVGGSTESGMASQNSRNCLIWALEYLRVASRVSDFSAVLQTRGRVSFFSRKGVVLRNRVCLFVFKVLCFVIRADSCRAEPRGLGSFRYCATAWSGNRRIWRIRLSTTPI